MSIKKLIFLIAFLFIFNIKAFAQDTNTENKNTKEKKEYHYKNEFTIGIVSGIGFNVLNRVDGDLAVIPNNGAPDPQPGSPVYSTALSVNIPAFMIALEYWIIPSLSFRTESGLNMIVAGARHALSDFAYILSYYKINAGFRYYINAGTVFLGGGGFVNLPIAKPKIGFIPSKSNGNVNVGPYIEIGINYPVNKALNLEAFLRFSFATLPYTEKSDEAILTDILLSPLDFSFGIHYKIF